MHIEGATAIVTGGASGLGLAAAHRLSDAGAKTAVVDIAPVEKARSVLGKGVAYFRADVRSEADTQKAFEEIAVDFGPASILVNAAGKPAPFKRTYGRSGAFDLEVFREIVDINLVGSFNCARLVAEQMAQRAPAARGERGVIINVSSINAIDAPQGTVAYTAAKAGVQGMTLAMARDLGVYGIRVCTIAPGSFDTPMLSDAFDGDANALLQTVPFPNDRLGDPDDFAMLVEHICLNTMLNGAAFRIDGAARLK